MNKCELKRLLGSYKYEHNYFIEKSDELELIKENYIKAIKKLKEINENKNNLLDESIAKYTLDIFERENELAKLNQHLKDIEMLVDEVLTPARNALYYKYIVGLKVEDIAFKMHFSTQRIYQLISDGLNEIVEKEDVG